MYLLFLIVIFIFLCGRRIYRLLIPYQSYREIHYLPKFKTGDIILFSNSLLVRFLTGERWTHCGVVVEINERMYVLEVLPSHQTCTLTPVRDKIEESLKANMTVAVRCLNKDCNSDKIKTLCKG